MSGININQFSESLNDKADRDLGNLASPGGENHFINPALTNSPYTTNRILEIPQDIKLELNNGTLTLKAGSKVYIPNGFESDGTTPKFDVVTIDSDKTRTVISGITNVPCPCFYIQEENRILSYLGFSGSTAPTFSGQGIWYDTTNNVCKRSVNGGSTWDTVHASLPYALVTNDGTVFKSIDQVFNGFGYIGSTIFVLPGVKCQSSTGRNVDGTCISPVRTVSSVLTYDAGAWNNATLYFLLWTTQCEAQDVRRFTRNKEFSSQSITYSFDENENKWYFSNDNQTWGNSGFHVNIVGKFAITSGKITSFEPYTVDSVVNSNASNFSQAGRSYLSGLGMPSSKYIDLTLGASGIQYTAPANGYFTLSKTSTGSAQYVVINKYYDGSINKRVSNVSYSPGSGYGCIAWLPVKKGEVINISYTAAGSTDCFMFVYAEGEN